MKYDAPYKYVLNEDDYLDICAGRVKIDYAPLKLTRLYS